MQCMELEGIFFLLLCKTECLNCFISAPILQVFEPLREMIMSAPLEDARLLTYRYQRIRQDMESQVITRSETSCSPEMTTRY